MPDGKAGFASGGELTISEVDELRAFELDAMPAEEASIAHTDDTLGSVVYLGPSIFHKATPIEHGGRRLVFCMFYGCEGDTEFPRHALV